MAETKDNSYVSHHFPPVIHCITYRLTSTIHNYESIHYVQCTYLHMPVSCASHLLETPSPVSRELIRCRLHEAEA